jgi:hypothetical protein
VSENGIAAGHWNAQRQLNEFTHDRDMNPPASSVPPIWSDINGESIWKSKNPNAVAFRKAYMKRYNNNRRDQLRDYKKKRYIENREVVKARSAEYRSKHPAKVKLAHQRWVSNNREKLRESQRIYAARVALPRRKLRYKLDPQHRIAACCRTRIAVTLKAAGQNKSERTKELLGCDLKFFKEFVEHQFIDGMTWNNWGALWELDHVIPISHFNLVEKPERLKAFNYTNCKPVLKSYNRSKNASLPEPHQPFLI